MSEIECPFCGKTMIGYPEDAGNGETWSAHLYCPRCDARGPSSESRYFDQIDAIADANGVFRRGLARYTAVALVRRLAEGGCHDSTPIYDDPICYFCRGDGKYIPEDPGVSYAHADDCPYADAVAFLATIDGEEASDGR